MKNLLITVLSIVFVVSCSQSSNQQTDSSSPAASYVEYVWHSAGPNFNAENLAMIITKWNAIIDNSPCEMNGANILTPRGESDADFIWVMLWPSMEARDSAWDDWMNNMDSEWQDAIDGIMSVDLENVYAFKPVVKRNPSIPNQTSSLIQSLLI